MGILEEFSFDRLGDLTAGSQSRTWGMADEPAQTQSPPPQNEPPQIGIEQNQPISQVEKPSYRQPAQKFSKPCALFKKKNALAFFILVPDPEAKELQHREMLRIENRKPGEYYVIPLPLSQIDFHISHHKSGAFHWKLNQKRQLPREQEKDFQDAFFDYISLQSHFGWIVAYCLACGPGVEMPTLRAMLKLLAPYVPIPGLNSHQACEDIFKRRHVTFANPTVKAGGICRLRPAASGFLLVELKNSKGILHTLNFTIATDKGDNCLVLTRRVFNQGKGEVELREIDKDSIHATHLVVM